MQDHELSLVNDFDNVFLHLFAIEAGELLKFRKVKHVGNRLRAVKRFNNREIIFIDLRLCFQEFLAEFITDDKVPVFILRNMPLIYHGLSYITPDRAKVNMIDCRMILPWSDNI